MKHVFKLAAIFCTVVSVHSTALADVTAVWQETTESLAKQVLERSNIVSDFVQLIDSHFLAESDQFKNLSVTISDAPTPTIGDTEITLPYSYITGAIVAHAELEETREAALERALDTVEYTLYHLFGHYLAKDKSPDADDTAESLSSWLMIKSFPNGGEQWFENVTAFGRASQLLDGPLSDYWHNHSLYKSRQRKINCWILGSNPEEYERLLKPVLEPEKRRADCIVEWQTLNTQSIELLQSHLQPDSILLIE